MAQPVDSFRRGELRLRLLSALFLGPIALAAVYIGSPYFETLLGLAVLVMAWEWDRLCGGGRFGASGYVLAISVLATLVAAAARQAEFAVAAAAAGALMAYAVARATGRGAPAWIAVGAAVVGLPCATLIWLRFDDTIGLTGVLWLIGAVWVTDIGGFVFGRMIGGPRLAPTISPGKTWVGLAGAAFMAALWSLAWGLWVGLSPVWPIVVLGALAAVVSQAGDLAISVVKRRFGAKDASNVIPGHGGVLDRFDGMLTAAPALLLLVLVKPGGIFSW